MALLAECEYCRRHYSPSASGAKPGRVVCLAGWRAHAAQQVPCLLCWPASGCPAQADAPLISTHYCLQQTQYSTCESAHTLPRTLRTAEDVVLRVCWLVLRCERDLRSVHEPILKPSVTLPPFPALFADQCGCPDLHIRDSPSGTLVSLEGLVLHIEVLLMARKERTVDGATQVWHDERSSAGSLFLQLTVPALAFQGQGCQLSMLLPGSQHNNQ